MIYLDSNILIYAIEDATPRGDRVRAALAAADDTVAVSALVLHECLVGPLRAQNFDLRDRYTRVIDKLAQIELDTAVFVRAAELRATFGIRTPDALHLAAAQIGGCSVLWTNDTRLAAASLGLAIDVVSPL